MADPVDSILNAIAASGALGTAAYGLVDITKFFGGGVSRAGFGDVRQAVMPFLAVADRPGRSFGTRQMLDTLLANWMNGMPKADQKAVARSLIRLLLEPGTADRIAVAAGVDPGDLATAAQHIFHDEPLTDEDMRVLGAFDTAVSASLDYGYERGDQRYRNTAKMVACLIAVALSVAAGWALYGNAANCGEAFLCRYWLLAALLLGLVATPLAPMAKDVATALQKAVAVLKR